MTSAHVAHKEIVKSIKDMQNCLEMNMKIADWQIVYGLESPKPKPCNEIFLIAVDSVSSLRRIFSCPPCTKHVLGVALFFFHVR